MAQARGKTATRRKTAKRPKSSGGSSMLPWVAALAVLGGGILLYDNVKPVRQAIASLTSERPVRMAETPAASPVARPQSPRAMVSAPVPPPHPVTPSPAFRPLDHGMTAAIVPPAPIGKPGQLPTTPAPSSPAPAVPAVLRPGDALAGSYEAKFFLCGTAKQDDCVLSADRFVFHGQKIRLVGIEVPNIKKPRCEAERIKASDAELRVRAFLDSGPFDLVSWQGNGDEVDGHKLRVVSRNGRSLSDILVKEGLAKRPGGAGGWC
jgi:endonuclease YncB( thermonuclease family)